MAYGQRLGAPDLTIAEPILQHLFLTWSGTEDPLALWIGGLRVGVHVIICQRLCAGCPDLAIGESSDP